MKFRQRQKKMEKAEMDTEEKQKKRSNFATALAKVQNSSEWKGVLAYCEFSAKTMLMKPIPRVDGKLINDFAQRPLEDRDARETLLWLQTKGGLPNSVRIDCRDVLDTVAQESAFHPVRDWLEGLQWDGKPRLTTWLKDYLNAGSLFASTKPDHTPIYLSAIGKAWLISAVARVMEPGAKVDTVLVLEGPQGYNKSRALRTMMYSDDWFSDCLPSDLASRDARLHLRGKWLVEISELAAVRRSLIEATKAFISTQYDTFRPPYGRLEVTVPRQCVFAATTNEDCWLLDDTGGRRFWPVRIEAEIDITKLQQDRDQLFAEAYAAYKSGEKWWLEPEVLKLAEEEVALRQPADALEETVLKFAADKEDIHISDVFGHLGYGNVMPKGEQMRIAGILRRNKFKHGHRTRDGRRVRVWVNPSPQPAKPQSKEREEW
jgi:predicted P-loop ATPase